MASSGGGNPQLSTSSATPTPAITQADIGGSAAAIEARVAAQADITTPHTNNSGQPQRSAPSDPRTPANLVSTTTTSSLTSANGTATSTAPAVTATGAPPEERGDTEVFAEVDDKKKLEFYLCEITKVPVGGKTSEFYEYLRDVKIDKSKVSVV